MKVTELVLLAGLLSTSFFPARPQDEQETEKKKRVNAVTSFFQGEAERLDEEIEGSWMLMEYLDPDEIPLEDSVSGFATFHEGFLTWFVAVDAVEQRFFRMRAHVFFRSGAFRYRFDEQATLQLASVMSFTNDTEDTELEREPAGLAFEYYCKLEDGLLELRDTEGVVMSFRKIEAGEFPEAAIRAIESRRSGTPQWEEDGER